MYKQKETRMKVDPTGYRTVAEAATTQPVAAASAIALRHGLGPWDAGPCSEHATRRRPTPHFLLGIDSSEVPPCRDRMIYNGDRMIYVFITVFFLHFFN